MMRRETYLPTGMNPPPPLTYMLLSHYIRSLDRKFSDSRALTSFETLCLMRSPQHHLISTTHALLFKGISSNYGLACAAWERDLSISLSPED